MNIINKLREPMNGFTHFIGILLSILGTILLINLSVNPFKPYHFFSFSIFSAGMILLYTTSTLYHWLKISDVVTLKLRKVDHIMIFIYIAATYTPICVVALRASFGWLLLAAVWSVALVGITIKIFWMSAPRWLSTFIYILMGWLAVIVILPLNNAMQIGALMWLLLYYRCGYLCF